MSISRSFNIPTPIISMPRTPTIYSGDLSSSIAIPKTPSIYSGDLPNPITIPRTYSENSSEPISSKLTIYSTSGHMIQRYSQAIKSVLLPNSVDMGSITVIDATGNIIPFSYVPETTLGLSLTNPNTGEKVTAIVIKGEKSFSGKILSLDSQNVTLIHEGQIINIRKYDQVIVNSNDNVTQPRVIFGESSQPVTLSYLLSNISWTCVGTALIDKNNMYLRLAGNIFNNTECIIKAQTTLVSGEVFQSRQNQEVSYSPMMLKSSSHTKVQTSMLEDYTRYEVGNRIIRTKDVSELGTWDFNITKIYLHNIREEDVKFGYRFITPDYLPSCGINVYSISNDRSIDSYLGSNDIEESQKGDEVNIILGISTVLRCKSSIIVSNDIIVANEQLAQQYNIPLDEYRKSPTQDKNAWHIVTEDIVVDITNNNTEPSLLVVKHYVGNKYLVETRCNAYKKRENGYIEWYFQVPPKSTTEPFKDKFSCSILTASYY